ncbi:hypothetical protein D3C78_1368360 [compost metagenome]
MLRPELVFPTHRQADFVQALPLLRRIIEHQRLADPGARQRHAMADPRTHFRAIAPRILVQVQHFVAFTDRQVNGVAGQRRQLIQIRPGQGHQRQLFTGLKAQLDQFRPQQITDLRHHPQITLVHQATGQAMGGAARGADQPGDFLEIAGAAGHGMNHTQTAKQSLGAGRCGVLGDFWGVFLHIQPLPLSE